MRAFAKASSIGSNPSDENRRGSLDASAGTGRDSGDHRQGPTKRTRGLALAVLVGCLLAMAIGPALAQAKTAYVQKGEFGGAEIGALPTGIAVEEATGEVLVTDRENNRVVVFASGQPGAAVLATFGEGELSEPSGIAIDQDSGDVYVGDAGNNRIVRYVGDGAVPPVYSRDLAYVGPAAGSGDGEVGDFGSPLAVDPGTGDLLLADRGDLRIDRYATDGSFTASFDGTGTPSGPFTSLTDIAASPDGTLYIIADGTFNELSNFWAGQQIQVFGPAGAFREFLGSTSVGAGSRYTGNATSLAYDGRLQQLVVADTGSSQIQIHVLKGKSQTQFTTLQVPDSLGYPGDVVAPQTPGLPVSLLISKAPNGSGSPSIQALGEAFYPEVEARPATELTASGARINGMVNPNGEAGTTYHFEYRIVGAPGWESTAEEPLASASPELVSAELSGLLPSQGYEFRITATTLGLSSTSETAALETLAVLPVAETFEATGVTDGEATLNGSLLAEGAQTTYFFEYGTTTDYGNQAPFGPPAPGGAERIPHNVSQNIPGLNPGTTYHFRLVVRNSAGTAKGQDRSFTTAQVPAEARSYEEVTPVDQKGGVPDGVRGAAALPDGIGITYATHPAGGEPTNSAPFYSRRISLRTPDAWAPPLLPDPPFGIYPQATFILTVAVSDDGLHALVATNEALTPGALHGNNVLNLYVEDLSTGIRQLVGSSPEPEALGSFAGGNPAQTFQAGAPDFSWVDFISSYPLLPGVPGSALYRWSASGLEVASTFTGGIIPGTPVQRTTFAYGVTRQVSRDGRAVAFGLADGPVYYAAGGVTDPASVSAVDGLPKNASLLGLSSDGRYVFFVSAEELVPGAPTTAESAYRYDSQSGHVDYVGQILNLPSSPEVGVLGISADGSEIFHQDGLQIEMWKNGTNSPVASTAASLRAGDSSLSSDGRFFAYVTEGDIYLFDALTGNVSCASCVNGQPTHVAIAGSGTEAGTERTGGSPLPQWVDDHGRVFFTTPAALVPSDINGVNDVYSYQEGHPSLISPGNAPFAARLMDTSREGKDVYFITDQPLVSQDTNKGRDVYDARVGGGLASQNSVPTAACAGEACQGGSTTRPSAPGTGSEAVTGVGPPTKHKAKQKPKQCVKKKTKGKAPANKGGKCAKHSKKGSKQQKKATKNNPKASR